MYLCPKIQKLELSHISNIHHASSLLFGTNITVIELYRLSYISTEGFGSLMLSCPNLLVLRAQLGVIPDIFTKLGQHCKQLEEVIIRIDETAIEKTSFDESFPYFLSEIRMLPSAQAWNFLRGLPSR
jgi:hypothetical protein